MFSWKLHPTDFKLHSTLVAESPKLVHSWPLVVWIHAKKIIPSWPNPRKNVAKSNNQQTTSRWKFQWTCQQITNNQQTTNNYETNNFCLFFLHLFDGHFCWNSQPSAHWKGQPSFWCSQHQSFLLLDHVVLSPAWNRRFGITQLEKCWTSHEWGGVGKMAPGGPLRFPILVGKKKHPMEKLEVNHDWRITSKPQREVFGKKFMTVFLMKNGNPKLNL